jgi:hypothetical protein
VSAELGRTAYAAYSTTTGGRTHDGRPMPTWDDLGDLIRAAWIAAALAAGARVEHHLRSIEQHLARIDDRLATVITKENKIMTDQEHLDTDVQALGAGLDEIVAEIAALKDQPGATALDFTALDGVVTRLQGVAADNAPPADVSAPGDGDPGEEPAPAE